ncbi:MAG: farnesyl diphosphate synthase [Arenimonas sp.]|jgi:farnesyl diphosphate synthase
MPVESLFPVWLSRTEAALDLALSRPCHAPGLAAAMRHAVLGGGKRLRPLLVHAAGHAFGGRQDALDAPAAAVELIHAFSLVHDDLPAMDDDDLRRGRPTVHVAFDVATAILAGDALQALAFSVLADAPLDAHVRVALVRELAGASGAAGMCAGQALDMAATGQTLDQAGLEHLHALKTGALIRAAVRMGALTAGAPEDVLPALDAYADALGLAFQIRDDILDVEGNAAQLGKTAGKDQAQGKSTYPGVLGITGSRRALDQLSEKMHAALDAIGPEADALRVLAEFTIARAH